MEWISVKKKLPEFDKQKVLIYTGGLVKLATFVKNYNTDKIDNFQNVFISEDGGFFGAMYIDNLVWAELPEPPQN